MIGMTGRPRAACRTLPRGFGLLLAHLVLLLDFVNSQESGTNVTTRVVENGTALAQALRNPPPGELNYTILMLGNVFNLTEAPRVPPTSAFAPGEIALKGSSDTKPVIVDMGFISEGMVRLVQGLA